MLLCPRCKEGLGDVHDEHGVGAGCVTCGGRAVTFADLGTALAPATAAAFEHALRSAKAVGRRPCPECSGPMREIPAGGEGPPVVVAGCASCRLAWFDADGVARLSPRPPRRARRGQADAAEVIARAALARGKDADITAGIDMWSGEGAAGLLGLPTVHDAPRTDVVPWVTYALVGAILAVPIVAWVGAVLTDGFGESFEVLRSMIRAGGFVPARPWRHGGSTWITSSFLHAGPAHLLVNAWALYVSARVVEARLGHLRLAALFLLAAFAGNLLEVATSRSSWIPRVGASGAISGLFAWCALAVPKLKIGVYFPNLGDWRSYTFIRVLVPVRWMFGFWLVLQVLGALGAAPGVAIASHFGGALAGVLWWAAGRRSEEPVPTAPAVLPPLAPKPERSFAPPAPVAPVAQPTVGAMSAPAPDAVPSASGFELAPDPPRRSSPNAMDVPATPPAGSPLPEDTPPPERTTEVSVPTIRSPSTPVPRRTTTAYEWTMAEGLRDVARGLWRRSPLATAAWAAASTVILAGCAAIPGVMGYVGFSRLTFVVAFLSFGGAVPTGLLFGRGLVEEVGFAGGVPIGLAAGASALVVILVGLVVGFLFPGAGALHRTVVVLFGAGGAVAGAIRATWVEH